jgi:putative ABC transport system permease protein
MEIEAAFAKPGRVIGVVKDFHFRSLHFPIEPLAFFVTPSRLPFSWKGKTQEYLPFSYISVKLAGSNIPGAVRFIQAFCNRHISDDPGAWSFFDDEFGLMYAAEMKTARVFGGLSLLATLLAGMGVFGLSAFMIERRRKEISIRKVLGAAPGRILYLLSSDFLKLLLIAGVLAVPVVGLAMRRWLDGFAYRIVLGPWYFAGGLAFLTVLLVATVAWHGLRAAWSNTAADLRSE